MAEETKHFWASMPGILTGVAAVITAVTTLVVTLTGKEAPPAVPVTPAGTAPVVHAQPSAPGPVSAAERAIALEPVAAPEPAPAARGSLFRAVDPPDHVVSVRASPSKEGREVARLQPGQTVRCVGKVAGQFRQYAGEASADWYDCPEAGGYVFSLLLKQAR